MSDKDIVDEMEKLAREELAELGIYSPTPNQIFAQVQILNLQCIEAGFLAAIPLSDGDILYKHVKHCNSAELDRKLTPLQYTLLMQR